MRIKRYSGACLFFLIACLPIFSQDSEKITIAVTEFQAQGISEEEASIITNRIRSELTKTDVYTVVERGQMEAILKEQGFQQSGCATDECIVEVGQLLGVKKMVAGSIGKIGSMLTINAKIIDVATGKILTTVDLDCKCRIEELLTKTTKEVAGKLAQYMDDSAVGKEPGQKEMILKPEENYGSVLIKTKPEGATVLLNGTKVGNTPYSGEIMSAGSYFLEITLDKHETLYDSIIINARQKLKKSYTLEKTGAENKKEFYKNGIVVTAKYEFVDEDFYISLDYIRLLNRYLGFNVSGGYGFVQTEFEVTGGVVINFDKLLFCLDFGYDAYASLFIRTPVLFKIKRLGILLDFGFEPVESCFKMGCGAGLLF